MSLWEVPSNWDWTIAGEIADVVGGGTPPTKDPANFTTEGTPWITPADLTGYKKTYINRGARDLTEQGLANSSAKVVPKGAVLYTSRAPIGYCVIAMQPISTNQGFKNLVLYDDILPEFVRHYLLRSKDYAESLSSGTTFLELSATRMKELEIPIAPLSEQRRIVSKIESLQERSSCAGRSLSEVGPLLSQFRQSVLQAAFSGRLTADWRAANTDVEPAAQLLSRIRAERRNCWEQSELAKYDAKGKNPPKNWQARYEESEPVNESKLEPLPKGWSWVHLDELADVQLGQRRAPEFSKFKEYPYIRAGNITWKGLDLSEVKSMGFASPDRLILQAGDVLLNEASGSPHEVGKPAIWRGEISNCCFQATVIRLRSRYDSLRPEWLYFSRLFDALLGKYAAQTPGIGIIHLTASLLRRWPIPLPPVEEQDEAIKRLYSVLKLNDTWEASLAESQSALSQLDQSILANAYRGKLVPQDSRDEPASKILARIQATKATALKRTKRRSGGKRSNASKGAKLMKTLMEALANKADWVSAQDAFALAGVGDTSDTDDVERLYEDLRRNLSQIDIERRGNEDWLRLKSLAGGN